MLIWLDPAMGTVGVPTAANPPDARENLPLVFEALAENPN